MFKVKNRTTEQRYSLCCGVFIVDLNIQTPFSRIFIADFEYVFFFLGSNKSNPKRTAKNIQNYRIYYIFNVLTGYDYIILYLP